MRTRYTLDASSGLLVDRDGETLGRVVSITIDDAPARIATTERVGYGERRSSLTSAVPSERPAESKAKEPHTPRPTATQIEREGVQRIWAYWLEITGLNQKLDSKRERIIRRALQLVGEERTKLALRGLSLSPHHNGQNDQRRKYLEVRYALRGIGDESDDERIAKAIGWATTYGSAPSSERAVAAIEARMRENGLEPARGWRLLEDVRQATRGVERARGERARVELEARGFVILLLGDTAPYARLSW